MKKKKILVTYSPRLLQLAEHDEEWCSCPLMQYALGFIAHIGTMWTTRRTPKPSPALPLWPTSFWKPEYQQLVIDQAALASCIEVELRTGSTDAGIVVEMHFYAPGKRDNGALLYLQCYIENTSVRVCDLKRRVEEVGLERVDTSQP